VDGQLANVHEGVLVGQRRIQAVQLHTAHVGQAQSHIAKASASRMRRTTDGRRTYTQLDMKVMTR
jgi:hypothetical protein